MALTVAALALLTPASAAAETSATTLLPKGSAWGTYVRVGDNVKSGRSALAALGCGGQHAGNDVAAVDAPGVSTGIIRTEVDAIEVGSGPGSRSTADIHDIRLLDGLITADAIKAVSTTWHDSSGFRGNGDGSAFLNLRIDGARFEADASGRVNLPGVGYVLLNRQIEQNDGAFHRTRMIEVHVTQDVPRQGLKSGTVIVVGNAQSTLKQAGGILGGKAFGSTGVVSGGGLLDADTGPSAIISMPCAGTDDQLRTNQILDVDVPPLFSLFNVRSTARGDVRTTTATVQLTDTIEEADVLDGLVHASAVRAVASGSAANGLRQFSSDGSGFAQLSVQGHPGIDVDVAPNTKVSIPGLGVLWLHRVIERDDRIEVRMIELEVTEPNDRGLPVGADVQVSVARAVIR